MSQIIRNYFEEKKEETTPVEDIMFYYYLDDISFDEIKNKIVNDRDNFLLTLDDYPKIIQKINSDEKLTELFKTLVQEALEDGEIQKDDVKGFLR